MNTKTALAVVEQQPRSVLMDMAHRYGMEPAPFEATLRATVCKGSVSREEFAAFLLVAKEYRLNPLTKEIYAFPAKGGGIQPIVSIDGWCRIINEHPALDGIEFDDLLNDGQLVAVTCRIYRKDRTRPTIVTEYMSECRRTTDVWKTWPARMLRHKALIQGARYAFGFSGIVDPDEYERITTVADPSRPQGLAARLTAAGPSDEGFTARQAEHRDAEFSDAVGTADIISAHDTETGEIIEQHLPGHDDEPEDEGFPGDKPTPTLAGADFDPTSWAIDFNQQVHAMQTVAEIKAAWSDAKAKGYPLKLKASSPSKLQALTDSMDARVAEIEGRG